MFRKERPPAWNCDENFFLFFRVVGTALYNTTSHASRTEHLYWVDSCSKPASVWRIVRGRRTARAPILGLISTVDLLYLTVRYDPPAIVKSTNSLGLLGKYFITPHTVLPISTASNHVDVSLAPSNPQSWRFVSGSRCCTNNLKSSAIHYPYSRGLRLWIESLVDDQQATRC
jgi:hypothetical protein